MTIEGNVSTVQQKELAIVQKDMASSREAYHTRFHDINVQRSYRKCTGPDHAQATVVCGRSSLSDKGGRAGHPDPELRGEGSQKNFFTAFQASVWSKNKVGGGGGVPGPFPWTRLWIGCFPGQTFEVWQQLKQTATPKVTLFTCFSSAHSAHLFFFSIFSNISCSETVDMLLRIILWSFTTPAILLNILRWIFCWLKTNQDNKHRVQRKQALQPAIRASCS